LNWGDLWKVCADLDAPKTEWCAFGMPVEKNVGELGVPLAPDACRPENQLLMMLRQVHTQCEGSGAYFGSSGSLKGFFSHCFHSFLEAFHYDGNPQKSPL